MFDGEIQEKIMLLDLLLKVIYSSLVIATELLFLSLLNWW